MKLSKLKHNAAHIEAEHWIGDLPEAPGLRLLVRGLRNADYRAAEQRRINSLPRNETLAGVAPATMDRIRGECLAETVLRGWEGLTDDDGAEIAHSPELAMKLLPDPDFDTLQALVMVAAGRVNEAAARN